MSRAEALYDAEDTVPVPWEFYALNAMRARDGRKGQAHLRFLRDHLQREAAEHGPKLAYNTLADQALGAGCAVGEFIIAKRMEKGERREDILAELDGQAEGDPWETAYQASFYGMTNSLAMDLETVNDEAGGEDPAVRWQALMDWLDKHIKGES